MTMLERVAHAIDPVPFEPENRSLYYPEEVIALRRKLALARASLILMMMREPTTPMIHKGDDMIRDSRHRDCVRPWYAMIDAALADQPTETPQESAK